MGTEKYTNRITRESLIKNAKFHQVTKQQLKECLVLTVDGKRLKTAVSLYSLMNKGEIFKYYEAFPTYYIGNMNRWYTASKKKLIEEHTYDNRGGDYAKIKMLNFKTLSICDIRFHLLVADLFIENPDNKPQVNHLNGKTDNSVAALEMVTQSENIKHAHKYIIKNMGIKVNKLDSNTLEILKTYRCLKEIRNDGFVSSQVNEISKICKQNNEELINGKDGKHTYKNYIWRYTELKDSEKFDDEVWYKTEDSIYDEVNWICGYKVSNKGRIQGLKGFRNVNSDHFSVRQNYIKKTYVLARFIAMALNVHNPDPKNKTTIDHIDSNHRNNCIENLRWASHKEQTNNPDSLLKHNSIVFVRDKNGNCKIYIGMLNIENDVHIEHRIIKNCAKNNFSCNGYTFHILNKKYINKILKNVIQKVIPKECRDSIFFKNAVNTYYNDEENIPLCDKYDDEIKNYIEIDNIEYDNELPMNTLKYTYKRCKIIKSVHKYKYTITRINNKLVCIKNF